jgi:hypothetical protein
MKSRDFGFLIIGAFLGLIGFGILKSVLSSRPDRAPTIAGQEVPKENFTIDFSRRYNLILSAYKGEKNYENVKILGYTGETVRESSGSLSSSYERFRRWLVVELPDRRRVYLSESSISLIEEVEPAPTQ